MTLLRSSVTCARTPTALRWEQFYQRNVRLGRPKPNDRAPTTRRPLRSIEISLFILWLATGSSASNQSRRIDCEVRQFPCQGMGICNKPELEESARRGSDCGPLPDERNAADLTAFPLHHLIVHCSSSHRKAFAFVLVFHPTNSSNQHVPSGTRTAPGARHRQHIEAA
jgi:hypothetical protein